MTAPPAVGQRPLGSPPPAAAAPRIHIGTVEVRSTAPAPTPTPAHTAAPRSDAAPIARAYAWRFGLVQG
jgi:hypothetical protein